MNIHYDKSLILCAFYRLRDDCFSVRHNAMSVLTYLILNDMVKVKGQIADIALCITDEEPRISGKMASLFVVFNIHCLILLL